MDALCAYCWQLIEQLIIRWRYFALEVVLEAASSITYRFEGGERMLVLSRKKNESIVVDDNIVITVIEIRGDKVRLGIQAPRNVPVFRSEIHAAIQRERQHQENEEENEEEDTTTL